MLELRKSPRFTTLAHARIPGVMEGENPLKDISITGCCVECQAGVVIKPDAQYELEIVPEKTAMVKNFNLAVEQKWMRPGEKGTEIGFIIVASPTGKQFQHYIDYLSYRNSAL